MNEEDQPLPSAVDAERSLLGALMLDDRLFSQADGLLDAADFYLDSHRRIYAAICTLTETGHAVDIVTLSERLRARKETDAVGGIAYLASLTEGVPRKPSITDYVAIIKDKARLRDVVRLADRTRARAYDESESAQTVLGEAQAEWDAATSAATATTLEPMGVYFSRAYPQIDAYYQRHKLAPGLNFGFRELDKLTTGMRPAELIVLAARPSMGKTAAAVNIAEHAALTERKRVAFFSLEMTKDQLLDRMVCSRAGVPLLKHRMGYLSPTEKRYCDEALSDILAEPLLLVDDTPNQSMAQMGAKAQRAKQAGGLDLVVIDYLQLMEPGRGASKGENREQQVAGMSRAAKGWAKKLAVPVLLLAQLSREVTKRNDKRPVLSDLRESGAIEQDADVVIFIHREEYYNKDETNQGAAEFIVAKQRQGPLGKADVRYRDSTTKFYDADDETEKP